MTTSTTTTPNTGEFTPATDPEARRRAYVLRAEGLTYPQIAERLGFRNQMAAYDAVEAHARRLGTNVPGYSARRAARTSAGIAAARTGGRQFGIEIEVMGLTVHQSHAALVAAGFDAYIQPYVGAGAHATPQNGRWKVITDSSLGARGSEVVTPPLKGQAGLDLVKKAMQALRAAGGRIESNCGLHVHHEVDDLTGEELGRLVEFYATHQAAINRLLAPSRRGRYGYPCGALTANEVVDFATRLRRITTTDKAAKKVAAQQQGIGGRPESRYRAINVHAFGNYGTIEFRQHQGTLNATKTAAWVRLGQAIIEAVRNEDTVATASFLDDLKAAGRLSAKDHDFLTRRQAALA